MNPSLGGFGLGIPASHDPEKASPVHACADPRPDGRKHALPH